MPWWALALRVVGIGWYIALCIVLGVAGGLWLDRRWGTGILFTLLGTGLGTAVAFYGMYQMIRPLMDRGWKR